MPENNTQGVFVLETFSGNDQLPVRTHNNRSARKNYNKTPHSRLSVCLSHLFDASPVVFVHADALSSGDQLFDFRHAVVLPGDLRRQHSTRWISYVRLRAAS